MTYEAKNFDSLLGLKGFSDQALKTHFTLYQGYVTNANKIIASLNLLLDAGKADAPEFAELKRRFGWEFNGMRLHELYFGQLKNGGAELPAGQSLAKKITADFGSFEKWQKDFRATGMMRGMGWAILYYDAVAKKLLNVWINEHDLGHLATCQPLLVMDMFEHAFIIDYGLKKTDYIEALSQAVDWTVVADRYKA